MERRSSILLPVVVATLFAGLAGYVGWSMGTHQRATNADEGTAEIVGHELLTNFQLPSLEGGTLGPADFRGEVVVVDFWATWCSPCRVQARILDQVREELPEDGYNFLAVSLGEEEQLVREFAENNPFPYPVLYDTDDTLSTEAEIFALPTVMIVDRSGKVSYMKAGLSDAPTLREALQSAAL